MLKHGMMPYWYELYALNKKLNHRNDIFRNVEDSFIIKYGDFKKEDVVLDIGCGDSTVPIFIKNKWGSKVFATDIDNNMLKIQKDYCSILNRDMEIEIQDATNLGYPRDFFNKIIAISSIEHIPENGDILSINEFSRILKPGGKCLITIPFGDYEENEKTWYYDGFVRIYDLENLNKRLSSSPYFKNETLLFLSSPNSGFIQEIYAKIGNIFDIYYKGNYHITNDNISIALTLGWIELTEEPRSSFGALICMEKIHSLISDYKQAANFDYECY